MTEQAIDLNSIREEYINFPEVFESVLMGTVSSDGIPDVSYAAYVAYEGDYYVYVSELSRHTQNLMDSGKVSLLFIENEDQAKHLFARQRVTFQCVAEEVERGCDQFESIMNSFKNRFGQFIDMLRNLTDFHLFRISPTNGSYVRGFAQAYRLEGKGLREISHINDKGHRAKSKKTEQQMDQIKNS